MLHRGEDAGSEERARRGGSADRLLAMGESVNWLLLPPSEHSRAQIDMIADFCMISTVMCAVSLYTLIHLCVGRTTGGSGKPQASDGRERDPFTSRRFLHAHAHLLL